jgi:cytochrome c553
MLLAAALVVQPALADSTPWEPGSIDAGKAKANTCAACHGSDGNSVNPEWPSLAGQHPAYIVDQLKAYQSGQRQNVLMTGMAMPLSEEDMWDLAQYFAAQAPAPRTAGDGNYRRGAEIYRGGILEKNVPACAACHGPAGGGNPLLQYPVVAGQHMTYLVDTLKAYASGERKSDADNAQMMRTIASRLSEDEMKAVAAFMQGLRPVE